MSVKFNKNQNGLSRLLPGEDHISGLLVYGTAPVGYALDGQPIRQIFSVKQAEELGILSTGTTKVWHYHISEFFRINPNSVLWVGVFPVPASAYDFSEVTTLQRTAEGKIRQVAVYTTLALATAEINALQDIAETLYQEHKPLIILYAADIQSIADLSTLPDLRTLSAHYVCVVIGQDAKNKGKTLFEDLDKSITCIGATLGAVSKAAVHENIGWIAKFDMAGSELDVIALANGKLIKNMTPAEVTALTNKGYIFLTKEVGINGSYHNDSSTCVIPTNDFAYIELNRTMDKAIRNIRRALLPPLKSPLYVEKTGELRADTIKYFENLAKIAVEQMLKEGELSAFSVNINPSQNIIGSGELIVDVAIVPVGVARTIKVNIGFSLKV